MGKAKKTRTTVEKQVTAWGGTNGGKIVMEESAFKAMVQEKELVCFNLGSYMRLCKGAPYDPKDFTEVWCPSLLEEVGRNFTLEKPVFLESVFTSRCGELLSEMKGQEETRLKLQKMLIKEEEEAMQKKETMQQRAAKGPQIPSVSFKDRRGTGRNRRRSMQLGEFLRFVKTHDLICYNYVACCTLYADEFEKPDAVSSEMHVWYPEKGEWEKFLVSELVYVEKLGPQHALIMAEEEETPPLKEDLIVKVEGACAQGKLEVAGQPSTEGNVESAGQPSAASAKGQDEAGFPSVKGTFIQGMQGHAQSSAASAKGQDEGRLASAKGKDVVQGMEGHGQQSSAASVKGQVEGGFALAKGKEVMQEDEEEDMEAKGMYELIRRKGNKATAKEIFIAMDAKLHGIIASISDLESVLAELVGAVYDQKRDIDALNPALSRVAERISRQSFCHFYERFGRFYEGVDPNTTVLPLITNKVLPYTPKSSLEAIGKLCSMPGLGGWDMMAHPTPRYAEIDVLMKVVEGKGLDMLNSPEESRVQTTSASEHISEKFNSIVIAEVTRSVALCRVPQAYEKPKAICNNASSKLLYKCVQLERGILAVMQYYGVPLEGIGGAAVISPSFVRLSEPMKLMARVLSGYEAGFECLQDLHRRHRLWLLDI